VTAVTNPPESHGDVSIGAVTAVLWRAKAFIAAAGVAAAAFAWISTRPVPPVYRGRTLLFPKESSREPFTGTLAYVPPAPAGGFEWRIPTGTVTPFPNFDVSSLEELIRSSDAMTQIAKDLHASVDGFQIGEVPRTHLIALYIDMPSADLARRAADALATAALTVDRGVVDRGFAEALQHTEAQIKALTSERMRVASQTAADRETKVYLDLLATELSGHYERLQAERKVEYDRLSVVQPAAVTADAPQQPRNRNAAAGFVAGALMASIAALGYALWRDRAALERFQ
jgi:hypothetical protein